MNALQRASGVLMPISSLYGQYGCGGFSKSAYEFVDFLSDCGFSYWQVLPLCLTDDYNSPYASMASFFGNPNFIDLETLFNKGLINKEELEDAKQNTPYLCEYEKLNSKRIPLLKKAATRTTEKQKILDFIDANEEVKNACLFLTLKEQNEGEFFTGFKNLTPNEETLFAYYFMQYEFYTQWQKLHEYANSKNIKILGDLPFYVSLFSSDVYFNKQCFLLDENCNPKLVAGVPPDYFSKTGQLWGNPIYNFDFIEKSGFEFFKKRFEFNFKLFDGIRIDHFRALSEYYTIPFGAKDAINGKWVKAPGEKIVDLIKEMAKNKLVIAENLGSIDDKVTALLDYSKFKGMSVFQFGFDGNKNNPHLPHNYDNSTVAFTGTHDNNTLLGFMWEAENELRQQVLDYIGFSGPNFDGSYDKIIECMLRSSAGLVLLPIQDILCFGADTRLNTPGLCENNWAFRITKEQLKKIDKSKYKKLNETFGRI